MSELTRTLQIIQRQRQAAIERCVRAAQVTPLPWNDVLLEEICSLPPRGPDEVLQNHPGYDAQERIISVESSRQVFECAVRDLLDAVEAFNRASEGRELFQPRATKRLDAHKARVQKELFAASSAAHSLVDHARKLHSAIPVTGYRERVEREFKNEPQHSFVVELRNTLHHVYAIRSRWSIDLSSETRVHRGTFFLNAEELCRVHGWSRAAMAFINRSGKQIDVSHTFASYYQRVTDFHDWWRHAIESSLPPEVADYRRCQQTVFRVRSRSFYRSFLTNMINQGIDPYDYLHQELSSDELHEIEQMPTRSTEQVDRIIEIVDAGREICDEELRRLVYKLFKVELA